MKKIYWLSIFCDEIVECKVFRNYKKDRYYIVYTKDGKAKYDVGYDECYENYEDAVKVKIKLLKEQLSEKEKQIENIKNEIRHYEKEILKDE